MEAWVLEIEAMSSLGTALLEYGSRVNIPVFPMEMPKRTPLLRDVKAIFILCAGYVACGLISFMHRHQKWDQKREHPEKGI
jgi:hypothetical protein